MTHVVPLVQAMFDAQLGRGSGGHVPGGVDEAGARVPAGSGAASGPESSGAGVQRHGEADGAWRYYEPAAQVHR